MSAPFHIFETTGKWLSEQGWPYEAYSLTESTNTLAKMRVSQDPLVMVYLADEQSNGRGRASRTWTSPPSGSSLMATWSFVVDESPQPLTAPLTGLALYETLRQIWPTPPWGLKSPNDIYLSDKKVGGLLLESVSHGTHHRLLIGLGLNVTAAPQGVDTAGCLADHLASHLTVTRWRDFLYALHRAFTAVAANSRVMTLADPQRQALGDALRHHPFHSDLKEVSPEGNLVYSSRIVQWSDQ